jgi:hypothetical protein
MTIISANLEAEAEAPQFENRHCKVSMKPCLKKINKPKTKHQGYGSSDTAQE